MQLSDLADIQQCCCCNGAIPREDFVRVLMKDGWVETLLLCEFCKVGYYSLWQPVGGGNFTHDFSLDYRHSTEPENYAAFVRDLNRHRTAAVAVSLVA